MWRSVEVRAESASFRFLDQVAGEGRCVGELLHDQDLTNESGEGGDGEKVDGSRDSWVRSGLCTMHVM